MPTFQCRMNGRNFLVSFDGKEQKMGFYTSCYVRSPNAKQAELVAVQLIRDSETRELVKNKTDDTPMIYLDEIVEIESVDSEDLGIKGKVWYTETKWWEFWRWRPGGVWAIKVSGRHLTIDWDD